MQHGIAPHSGPDEGEQINEVWIYYVACKLLVDAFATARLEPDSICFNTCFSRIFLELTRVLITRTGVTGSESGTYLARSKGGMVCEEQTIWQEDASRPVCRILAMDSEVPQEQKNMHPRYARAGITKAIAAIITPAKQSYLTGIDTMDRSARTGPAVAAAKAT